MPTSSSNRWIERLKDLHPLLMPSKGSVPKGPTAERGEGDKAGEGASPSARRWAAEKIEMDAAAAADDAAASVKREREARRREEEYDNPFVTWAGFAVAAVIAVLGLLLVEHLIQQSRLEDCLLAHHSNCEPISDQR